MHRHWAEKFQACQPWQVSFLGLLSTWHKEVTNSDWRLTDVARLLDATRVNLIGYCHHEEIGRTSRSHCLATCLLCRQGTVRSIRYSYPRSVPFDGRVSSSFSLMPRKGGALPVVRGSLFLGSFERYAQQCKRPWNLRLEKRWDQGHTSTLLSQKRKQGTVNTWPYKNRSTVACDGFPQASQLSWRWGSSHRISAYKNMVEWGGEVESIIRLFWAMGALNKIKIKKR